MKIGCKNLLALLFWSLSACATVTPTSSGPRTLTLMTHNSFAASEEVIQEFEQANFAKLKILPAGDTGAAVNKAILSKGNPLADVFYGVDNTFISRAMKEDIFEAYNSPVMEEIPDAFKLDPQSRLLPVDYGDVCPNYDLAYFAQEGLPPPQSIADLTKPEYKGLLVVENPATSSPGLAFLLATIGRFGSDGYLDYWQSLMDNDALVVNDWESAYYTEFSTHGGTRPVVISYGSSPPAEIIFADPPIDEPLTGVITADLSCFRQIEFVGILKGTESRDLAEKWIDFMLSTRFQEDMPLQMFVFPVNKRANLPEAFARFATIPDDTAEISPEEIDINRDAWLQEWTQAVLR